MGLSSLITLKREKHKDKRKRSKITRRKSLRVVIPEWFYRESKLTRDIFPLITSGKKKAKG